MDTKIPNIVMEPCRTQSLISCPQCNAMMVAVERCIENGVLFVWYECSSGSCEGQWLQKMSYDCTMEEVE